MAENSETLKGLKELKSAFFCQKILARNEFLDFCTELRDLPSYGSLWEKIDWTNDLNRMVIPADSQPNFPQFFAEFRSKTWSGPGYSIEWTAGSKISEDLHKELLTQFRELGQGEKHMILVFFFEVAGQPVEFWFRWESGSEECTEFAINWFFGGYFELDKFPTTVISQEFGVVGRTQIPAEFRKAREREVKETLSFLKSFRLGTASTQLTGMSPKGEEIWRAFVSWDGEIAEALKLNFKILLGNDPASSLLEWSPTPVWNMQKLSEGTEACVVFNLENLVAKNGRNYDQDYHEWLANFSGNRTLSGKCAIFGLGIIGATPTPGLVSVYLEPAGYIVGYTKVGFIKTRPPKEVCDLVPEAEWIKGVPPSDADLRHPIYSGGGEFYEPVPQSGVEADIKSLVECLRKWTPPDREIFSPDSFEGQFDKLGELGFKLTNNGDRDDFLENHDRDWYERFPYLNILFEMGLRNTLTRCSRFWYLDFEKSQADVDLSQVVAILNTLTNRAVPITRIKSSEVNKSLGSYTIEFELVGEHVEWNVEGMMGWIDMDLIEAYDHLLQEFATGYRIYWIKKDGGGILLSGLKPEEAAELNQLLSTPFRLIGL
jgi:hypothetical protein